MDLRKLRYFIEVVEQGSITKAAGTLRVTQPALSRQIRAFEDEMGWSLLDRGARSIRLTRHGEVVVREGKMIRDAVDASLLRMKTEIEGGVLRVGYAPSLGGELLKNAIGCFAQRHPDVRIDLRDSTSQEMLEKVKLGELDLMVGVKVDQAGYGWEDLDERRLVMAVPEPDELSRRRRIQVGDLAGRSLLLLSRHDYPEYWASVANYFRANGANAKVAGEFDGIESLGLALKAGLGLAMVAEHSAVGKGVKLIPLKPEPETVKVAVGWRDDRALNPINASFVEELVMQRKTAHSR